MSSTGRYVTDCSFCLDKGKKFNARKETAQGEEYYGLKIFRFYIVSLSPLLRKRRTKLTIDVFRNAPCAAPRSLSRPTRRTQTTYVNMAPRGTSKIGPTPIPTAMRAPFPTRPPMTTMIAMAISERRKGRRMPWRIWRGVRSKVVERWR